MTTARQDRYEEILKVLIAQHPGRAALSRVPTAIALGHKNGITVDRLRARGVLKPSIGTGRPVYTLSAIASYLAETSEGA